MHHEADQSSRFGSYGDIPDDAKQKILDVMRVPKDEFDRRLPAAFLDDSVRDTLYAHKYLSSDFYGKKPRAQNARVATDAERLLEDLRLLDSVARKSLDDALLEEPGPHLVQYSANSFTFRPIFAYERLLRLLAKCARLKSMRKPKGDPHRPRRSVKHPAFHLLLRDLRELKECFGGRRPLTCWRENGELKGTVPTVVEMLRPCLPGVIPEKLSYSSIRRALQKAPRT